jgi:hypothetical protein
LMSFVRDNHSRMAIQHCLLLNPIFIISAQQYGHLSCSHNVLKILTCFVELSSGSSSVPYIVYETSFQFTLPSYTYKCR